MMKKCYKEVLNIADQGVDFCIQYGNLAFFPLLILNKGVALAELNQISEAEKYLHQAITILSAVKREDLVETVIDWCRLSYKIDFNNRQL